MSKMKKFLFATLALASVACVSVAGLSLNDAQKVQAEETTESIFAMTPGASIRLEKGEYGIKWETNVSRVYYNAVVAKAESQGKTEQDVSFHTVIGPANETVTVEQEDVTQKVSFDKDTVLSYVSEGYHDLTYPDALVFDATGMATYYGAIYYDNVSAQNFKSASDFELVGQAYVSIGDEVYELAEAEDTNRSMRGVATYCLLNNTNPDDNETLKKYIGTTANTATSDQGVYGAYGKEDKNGAFQITVEQAGTYTVYAGAKIIAKTNIPANTKTIVEIGEYPKLNPTTNEEYRIGNVQRVYLINDETGDMYSKAITYCTRAISTQSELNDTFALVNKYTDNGNYMSTDVHGGLYLLTNDIEPEYDKQGNKVLYNVRKNEAVTLGNPGWAHVGKGGLSGTFDGKGYTIRNLLIYEWGLFGYIGGGTVQNVSIENCELTGRKSGTVNAYTSRATLAYAISGSTKNVGGYGQVTNQAWLKNVNIATDIISNDYYQDGALVTNTATTSVAARALVASVVRSNLSISNCKFSVAEIENVGDSDEYGSFCCRYTSPNNMGANAYIVSPYEAMHQNSTTNASTYLGAERYSTEESMISAKKDLSAFVIYWNTDDYTLTWVGND